MTQAIPLLKCIADIRKRQQSSCMAELSTLAPPTPSNGFLVCGVQPPNFAPTEYKAPPPGYFGRSQGVHLKKCARRNYSRKESSAVCQCNACLPVGGDGMPNTGLFGAAASALPRHTVVFRVSIRLSCVPY